MSLPEVPPRASNARGIRRCSRSGCSHPAVTTLTYVYRDSTAVLGPLASVAEPHCYDLCVVHSQRLTAPRGWEIVRLTPEQSERPPHEDDLLAVADAVREHGTAPLPAGVDQPVVERPGVDPVLTGRASRRGHLMVLPDPIG